jgi:hypothetical protein
MDDPAAKRVDARHILKPDQRRLHPEGPDGAPAAHTVCDANPIGMGFTEPWYLKATGLKKIPAPQIDCALDPVLEIGRSYRPRGFGTIARSWQPRLGLAGTYDDNWLRERWPGLPDDFDFAYWNCAHPDLRVPYLRGDEIIELTNLTPGGKLTFQLPGSTPFVLVRYEKGEIAPAPANLDTLVIEPDNMRVSIVWRTTVPAAPEIRVLESRLITQDDTDELALAVREVFYG